MKKIPEKILQINEKEGIVEKEKINSSINEINFLNDFDNNNHYNNDVIHENKNMQIKKEKS